MAIVLLILGVAEYGVSIIENYIIAGKSQMDEIVYQYSGNILSIFSSVFVFVNTGFLTMLTVRETATTDMAGRGKRKNISRVFQFGCIVGLGSGLGVMCILLFLRAQLFELLGQGELAPFATTFFSIRSPFVPFEYVGNVLAALLMGLMQIRPLLIASLVSNGLYIPVLILLLAYMEDTVAAIAWANGFQIIVYLALFIIALSSQSFRSKYEICDTTALFRRPTEQKTPLLSPTMEDGTAYNDGEKDPITVKQMGKASGLLFAKNLFSTLATVTSYVMLSGVLSTEQFVAYNVLQNTIQFSSFAIYFNTVLNIFGPRLISAGLKEKYTGLFHKAHINTLMLGAASFIGYFAFHTGTISLDNLTSSGETSEVGNSLSPIWPIWMVNIMFTMYQNLYDTVMINFQKYFVLGTIGVVNAVCISIPITLVSALKYNSIMGIILAPLVSNVVEVAVTAYLFHFKYMKDPLWENGKAAEPDEFTTPNLPSKTTTFSVLSSSGTVN